MAPERILGGGRVTVEGDIWAFGMTMLVCSSHHDFPHFSYKQSYPGVILWKTPFQRSDRHDTDCGPYHAGTTTNATRSYG